jgi:hypothetical protein
MTNDAYNIKRAKIKFITLFGLIFFQWVIYKSGLLNLRNIELFINSLSYKLLNLYLNCFSLLNFNSMSYSLSSLFCTYFFNDVYSLNYNHHLYRKINTYLIIFIMLVIMLLNYFHKKQHLFQKRFNPFHTFDVIFL